MTLTKERSTFSLQGSIGLILYKGVPGLNRQGRLFPLDGKTSFFLEKINLLQANNSLFESREPFLLWGIKKKEVLKWAVENV